MSFTEHLAEDRRLVILRFLKKAPGYELNASVLQSACDAVGHNVSRAVILADIEWLKEGGLVTTEDVHGIVVATATHRGLDVAGGRAQHPGVNRPSPKV